MRYANDHVRLCVSVSESAAVILAMSCDSLFHIHWPCWVDLPALFALLPLFEDKDYDILTIYMPIIT